MREEKEAKISLELIRHSFDYSNGNLFWKNIHAKSSLRRNGDIAQCLSRNKVYYVTKFLQNYFPTHRLIFFWHHGYFPAYVDHLDRNTLNNNISNLREATASQNTANSSGRKIRRSKYKGVNEDRKNNRKKRWRALIACGPIKKDLGYYKTEEEAALAYNKEAVKLHREFAYLNIIIP